MSAPSDPQAPDPQGPDPVARARDAVAAAESRPADIPLQLQAAEALFRAGDAAAAVAFARKAVALDAEDARSARVLSGLLAAAGDADAAILSAYDAVRLNPANAEARLHLGALLAGRRRWREAAAHLAVHVEAAGSVTTAAWRLLASVLHQGGEDARATDAAMRAVEAEPSQIENRLHLVSLLCSRGMFADADMQLAAALALEPGNPTAWRTYSGSLAAQGRLSEALAAAERAVELAGDDADCRAHLAHVAGLCQVPAVAGEPDRWQVRQHRPARRPRPPRRPGSLWQDAATRWRVIYAIMLRDIRTRFGHTRLGYFWAIVEPIGHLATLGTVFYALNHSPPPLGNNLFLFYITGLVPFLMFSHVSHDMMGVADGSSAMLQIPIVRRTDVIAAHAIRQLATELVVGIIIFATAGLIGLQGLPADPAAAAAGVLLLWLLAVGIGVVNVVLSGLFPSYDTFYAALIRLLYFASGIYYSPITMPDMVRRWLLWNPVL
ncbi:MAG TPA: ABC transporter permease, partial [Rhodopila sp.]|nr:ABC transporter permease [Rhodopila sp.]